jgi:hypothetical protein
MKTQHQEEEEVEQEVEAAAAAAAAPPSRLVSLESPSTVRIFLYLSPVLKHLF